MGFFSKLFKSDEEEHTADAHAGHSCHPPAEAGPPIVAAPPGAKPVAVLELPIASLADVEKPHADTWNIVHRGYSKHNENNCIEQLPDGPACSVHFPEGSINPTAKDRPLGGLGFYAAPAILPGNDVELTYQLQFAETFQPQRGGKLPGLFFCPAGCKDIHGGSGGKHSEHHASLRMMWRKDMQAEAYVYSVAAHDIPAYKELPHSHYNVTYGDSLWRGEMKFHKAGWNTVRMRVRMNNVGKADGWLFVEVNGVAREFNGMLWRHEEGADVQVSALFMSTFYGGSKPEFACPCDTHIRFKDFTLRKWS